METATARTEADGSNIRINILISTCEIICRNYFGLFAHMFSLGIIQIYDNTNNKGFSCSYNLQFHATQITDQLHGIVLNILKFR